MQAGRSAMEAAKEAAANVGASACSGMEKTRATLQGHAEKAAAHGAADREAAATRARERVHGAEEVKRDAMRANAAAKERASAGAYHPSQGAPGVVPGGAPAGGHVEDGVAGSRPLGTATGTGRPSVAHNPRVGGGAAPATGTGGQYQ
ncbi:11 kDa late embryogenesis abundant protein [Hordeum vulgare]|uniref:Uncharacterized protein n=1 Tax=Hordeum vulgare subsp. vulgare TaxID=112509 RepID=A0A8I6Z5S5_HORVV|nr:11 kDa late embryogenesis abundant protein-like [Hordeum vulgare subsp. vulgare]KAE8767723.1 11 kDa late embryogenesis abundant protein [Hordeum vulgare]KAI4970594.1 hypothetical protein ZWY2020_001508 [Hordeum vulgare]